MKKSILILCLLPVLWFGCDQNFDEINKNPNDAGSTDSQYLFTYISQQIGGQYLMSYFNHHYLMQWTMQTAYSSGYSSDSPFDNLTDVAVKNLWEDFYTSILINNEILIAQTSASNELVNKNAMARILKVFTFHLMTDLWGDIPYSEAVSGLAMRNLYPKYDRQEDIYQDMLSQLQLAIDDFDTDMPVFRIDILFNGNIEKWKRFARSLRLRLAIRSNNAKVVKELMDEDQLMKSNDDNATFLFPAESKNWSPFYEIYTKNPLSLGKISDFLLKTMQKTNDPRISLYAQEISSGSNEYHGVPSFLKVNELSAMRVSAKGTSYLGIPLVGKPDGTNTLISYSEVCFLKAEAARKGWCSTDVSADFYYYEAIKANMEDLGILADTITAYIAKISTTEPETDILEKIGTQKWISLYLNGFESFAEYRRTGYPVFEKYIVELNGRILLSKELVPLGEIPDFNYPNRIPYPSNEVDLNKSNYEKAISHQGADTKNTQLWWQSLP